MTALDTAHVEIAGRAGGLLPAEDASRLLGITEVALEDERRAGYVLAVKGQGAWLYPACQFRNGRVVDGIARVISELSPAGP